MRELTLPLVVGTTLVGIGLAPTVLDGALGLQDQDPVKRPAVQVLETQTGEAGYYHPALDGRRTVSGEILDQTQLVAAHRTYPFGTLLRVTNLRNQRSVTVRVIDRGPFHRGRMGRRILDLSRRAAEELGFLRQGVAPVKVEVLQYGKATPEN